MQIYVVQPGDSLYAIANRFGTTVQAISLINEINPELQLVVGQALVIPVPERYIVKKGDTLSAIAKRYGITVNQLRSANRLAPNAILSIGMSLIIPRNQRTPIQSNAYIEPRQNQPVDEQTARKASPFLTYLAPFSYQILRNGDLKPLDLGNAPKAAADGGATLMLVVTNLENGQFSAELGEVILENEELQDKLLNNILQLAKQYGFSDIHFDLEHLYPNDREPYLNFLRKARDKIHGAGLLLSTALAPKTSASQKGIWYEAHDYKGHGEIVDFVILMTYEWGYSGGPPMAVSPIGPVRRVIEYALSEMPAEKIMMGQNLYGYDWTLPFQRGGKFAKVVSPQQAINIARNNEAAIQYDYGAQAPFFTYYDEQKKEHEVWFEDARSIQAKFNLIKEFELRGISYWKLGIDFPQNWVLLEDNFIVVKRSAPM